MTHLRGTAMNVSNFTDDRTNNTIEKQFVFGPVYPGVKTTSVSLIICMMIFGVTANTFALSFKVEQLRIKMTNIQVAFRRSVTSYLMISLSISDILTSIINPTIGIMDIFVEGLQRGWPCKISRFFLLSSLAITVHNLFLMSIEQYFCIFHWQKMPSPLFIKRAIVLVWIEAIIVSSTSFLYITPQTIDFNSHQYTIVCKFYLHETLPRFAYIFYFLLVYLVPLSFMSYSAFSILYSNKIKNSSKVTVLQKHNFIKARIFTNIIWAFVLPYSFILLYGVVSIFKPNITIEADFTIRYFSAILSFSNCCINPLIYFFRCGRFRNKVIRKLRISLNSVCPKSQQPV